MAHRAKNVTWLVFQSHNKLQNLMSFLKRDIWMLILIVQGPFCIVRTHMRDSPCNEGAQTRVEDVFHSGHNATPAVRRATEPLHRYNPHFVSCKMHTSSDIKLVVSDRTNHTHTRPE